MEKTYNVEIYGTNDDEKNRLETHFKEHDIKANIKYFSEKINPDNLSTSEAQVLSVFVDSIVDAKVMDKFPNLALIVARSTGYDNIDLAEAKKRNILVCNVPSYGECTVAEYTFGLILMLSRKIHLSINKYIELGLTTNTNIRGFDLYDKTIGIIGTGKIGKRVISIAKGFGMKILAYDSFPDKKAETDIGFQYVDLDHLLRHSDIVSIHIPFTKDTEHLINAKSFSLMKKDALIINTSRGGIIDTNALVEALNNKVIAGAGLDVLEEENIVKDETAFIMSNKTGEHNLCTIVADHALMKMPNVIVTPHNAYNTNEALDRILDTTTQNILAWIQGKPINVVAM
jgi:D-lactate dehydrogenase